MFKLVSKYEPNGDQPEAIKELVSGIKNGRKEQVLLGATGTGHLQLLMLSMKFRNQLWFLLITKLWLVNCIPN